MRESPVGGKAVVCAPFSVATVPRLFIAVVSNTSTTPGSPTATQSWRRLGLNQTTSGTPESLP